MCRTEKAWAGELGVSKVGEVKVSTPVQANPGYVPGGFVSPAVQLQPLSLLGLYDVPVEEPDQYCIPLGYPPYTWVLCWSP